MHDSAPFPNCESLVRLKVQDSTRINADRWSLAHDYHRQRQGVLHQALWEPGIITGLGVKVIDPPEHTTSQFKDQLWLEIQPGLAIDYRGNPIVVPPLAPNTVSNGSTSNLPPNTHRTYRLAVEAPPTEPTTVHVVLKYVDPDTLEALEPTDRTVEWYRFDQTLYPPTTQEIELCRIYLEPGQVALKKGGDPLSPQAGQVDLRFRRYAHQRSLAWIKMSTLTGIPPQQQKGLEALITALPSLCPWLGAEFDEEARLTAGGDAFQDCALLYTTASEFMNWLGQLNQQEQEKVKTYIRDGGTLLIEVDSQSDALPFLMGQLEKRGVMLQPLTGNHDIFKQPFTFGQTFSLGDTPLQLFLDGGFLVIPGDLNGAWQGGNYDRNQIRAAQEFGINILNFARQRHYLKQLLQ